MTRAACSTLVVALTALFTLPALAEPVASPLSVVGTTHNGVVTLSLDRDRYDTLSSLRFADLQGFALGPARTVDLSLERFDLFSDDAQVVAVTDDGKQNLAAKPDVQLWRGQVAGEPGSHVYLALTPHGTSGYIQSLGATYVISSGEAGALPTVIYDLASPAAVGIRFDLPTCSGAILPEGAIAPDATGDVYGSRAFSCRRLRIAVDCDTEFTSNRFANNTVNAQAYATALIGAVSEIYYRDMNLTLELSYLRTWGANDPYTQTNNSNQLPEFRTYWNSNMGSVSRNVAHLLSARNLGGGIAYLSSVCNTNAYGVSANLNGYFPYPLVDRNSQNWDVMVVTHELGHNFGTGHTHSTSSYNPIIDGCGSSPQDCSQASQGTIMSYCHTCSGGMTNMNLTFGPRPITTVRNFLDGSASGCGTYPTSTAITAQPTSRTATQGLSTTISVATNGTAPTAYQWKRNLGNLANGGRFSGVNSANLTINPVDSTDIGSYTVTMTTACGTLNSDAATLSVVVCPSIITPPTAKSVAAGSTVSLSVNSGGTFPRTFQWRKDNQPLTNGGRIFGADAATLTISGVTTGDQGSYSVVITNVCGNVTSPAALLTVTPTPCGSSDFDGDGDAGTDGDIEAFFACLAGACCPTCGSSDFDGDGDAGTDSDIESFFRVLSGGAC